MENLFFAEDGSASAHASARDTDLGFVGVVRFAVDTCIDTSIRHECLRYRDTRAEALVDARRDAEVLVARWGNERVRLGEK
jgi:hypothetical protein